jgi:hypothetical protein
MINGSLHKTKLLGKAIKTIYVLIILLLSACGKRGEIYMGPFSDTSLFLNTKIDKKIANEINIYSHCFDQSNQENWLWRRNVNSFEKALDEIFVDIFPKGTPISTVVNTLRASGATCKTEYSDNSDIISCKFTKEFIYGLKDFYLFRGWRVHLARLNKNTFEYVISSKNGYLVAASSKVIGGECYELDPQRYEESKIIQPIRRLQ